MANNVRATFDVTTVEGKMKVFNAQNGASISMKKVGADEIIECVGVMQYDDVVDSYAANQEATITVLFAADGQSYAGVSATVAEAGGKLIDLFADTGLEVINVVVVKDHSSKGNEFLNLRVKM